MGAPRQPNANASSKINTLDMIPQVHFEPFTHDVHTCTQSKQKASTEDRGPQQEWLYILRSCSSRGHQPGPDAEETARSVQGAQIVPIHSGGECAGGYVGGLGGSGGGGGGGCCITRAGLACTIWCGWYTYEALAFAYRCC